MKKKYFFTEQMDEMIRNAYAVDSRASFLAGLKKLYAAWPHIPTWIISARAEKLGVSFSRRPWTKQDLLFLQNHAGEMTLREICKTLDRNYNSVAHKMSRLGWSAKVRDDGYGSDELCKLFRVHTYTFHRWVERKMIKGYGGRFSDENVREFITAHHDAYDLRRVDQVWFKGLMFGMAQQPAKYTKKVSEAYLEQTVNEMMRERGLLA